MDAPPPVTVKALGMAFTLTVALKDTGLVQPFTVQVTV
jgi:hypothetical protein